MTVELNAEIRSQLGKGYSKKIRKQEAIPAVLYGKKLETQSLQVKTRDIENILKSPQGMNTLINLNVKGDKSYTVLIKDLQGNVISRALYHIDLWAVSADQEVLVNVDVRLEGRAPGQVQGGILEHVSHQIQLFCQANAIPKEIAVDVTSLEIGMNIHLSEVTLPAGVRAKEGYDPTLVAVVEEKKVEEPTPEVLAEGEEGAVAEGEEGAAAAEGAEGAAKAEGAEGEKKEAGKEGEKKDDSKKEEKKK